MRLRAYLAAPAPGILTARLGRWGAYGQEAEEPKAASIGWIGAEPKATASVGRCREHVAVFEQGSSATRLTGLSRVQVDRFASCPARSCPSRTPPVPQALDASRPLLRGSRTAGGRQTGSGCRQRRLRRCSRTAQPTRMATGWRGVSCDAASRHADASSGEPSRT